MRGPGANTGGTARGKAGVGPSSLQPELGNGREAPRGAGRLLRIFYFVLRVVGSHLEHIIWFTGR